jgi:pyrimidine deaminase RibD-like protein
MSEMSALIERNGSEHSCAAVQFYMRQALKLAESSIGLTDPNPRVGCVIVDGNCRVIGKGHTQERGGAHAEAAALQDAASAGESVVGSTAYVTLEPCCHHGSNHKVNLAAVIEDLTRREINEVHVEAGEKLNGSLLEAGLVDELLIYAAPLLLGPGNAIGVLPHVARLQECIGLTFHSVTLIGTDLRIVARHRQGSACLGRCTPSR